MKKSEKKIILAALACLAIAMGALGMTACKDKTPENSEKVYPKTYSYQDIHYSLSEDKTYYSVYACNVMDISDEIEILAAVEGLPVKRIEDSVFTDCEILTSVSMPDSLISIGENAFYRCEQLETVRFSSALESIGDYAFYGCLNLETVILPNAVQTVGAYAFVNCDSVTELVVGDSVTSIGKQAFLGCSMLTQVTLGEALKKVDYYAFADCDALINVTFKGDLSDWCQIQFGGDKSNPLFYAKNFSVNGQKVQKFSTSSSVKSIESWAFLRNKDLQSVTIGSGVQSIGQQAFFQCIALESVVVDRSVTTISSQAFAQCSSLTNVYYTGVAADWNLIKMTDKKSVFPEAVKVYYYSETKKTGNWWHYDENGVPTVWEA